MTPEPRLCWVGVLPCITHYLNFSRQMPCWACWQASLAIAQGSGPSQPTSQKTAAQGELISILDSRQVPQMPRSQLLSGRQLCHTRSRELALTLRLATQEALQILRCPTGSMGDFHPSSPPRRSRRWEQSLSRQLRPELAISVSWCYPSPAQAGSLISHGLTHLCRRSTRSRSSREPSDSEYELGDLAAELSSTDAEEPEDDLTEAGTATRPSSGGSTAGERAGVRTRAASGAGCCPCAVCSC